MWKPWKKWIFQISIEKKHGNAKEQTWFSLSSAWKIWKCGNHGRHGKNGFFRFQLKRKMEILKNKCGLVDPLLGKYGKNGNNGLFRFQLKRKKNKHGLVYQLLGKFGKVEIMEKIDF